MTLDPSAPSPSKRQRSDTVLASDTGTDSEVEAFEPAVGRTEIAGDGFRIHPCRSDATWLVIPKDVEIVDLQLFRTAMEGAGWKWISTSRGGGCEHYKVRSCNAASIRLYANGGRLLVEGSRDRTAALQAASLYVGALDSIV